MKIFKCVLFAVFLFSIPWISHAQVKAASPGITIEPVTPGPGDVMVVQVTGAAGDIEDAGRAVSGGQFEVKGLQGGLVAGEGRQVEVVIFGDIGKVVQVHGMIIRRIKRMRKREGLVRGQS